MHVNDMAVLGLYCQSYLPCKVVQLKLFHFASLFTVLLLASHPMVIIFNMEEVGVSKLAVGISQDKEILGFHSLLTLSVPTFM